LLNVLHEVGEAGALFKSLHATWADTTTPHGGGRSLMSARTSASSGPGRRGTASGDRRSLRSSSRSMRCGCSRNRMKSISLNTRTRQSRSYSTPYAEHPQRGRV
jgi:hypothetical protein